MCTLADTVTYEGGSEGKIEMPGSGRTIPTYVYGYEPNDPKPTVLIIHDVYGAKQLYRDMGKRLAAEGFAAILPDLFCREGELSENTIEAARARATKHSFPVALQDIEAIVNRLNQEGRKVGVIGFCMGGTLGLFVASRMPSVKASVVYYGFPVNHNPNPNRPDSPINEVANLQVPVLGFFGETDSGVGVENVKAYEEAARKAGKQLDFTIYPEAGHGFLTFDPAGATAKVSQDSWVRTLAFFDKNIGTKIAATA